MRSGWSSATALTASNPLAHSAMTSMSGTFARYSRNTPRASASSSTTTTRSRASVMNRFRPSRPRQLELNTKAFRLAPRAEPGRIPEHDGEAPAHVFQTKPGGSSHVAVTRVLDGNREKPGLARDVEADEAAVQHPGNAVGHGVFDERLKNQWGNETIRGRRVDPALNFQPGAEAHLFNVQEPVDQRQFVGESDAFVPADAQGVAQEVGEQDAHAPRASRIAGGQCADRVQAVVEEVRMDLCAQRSQFGLARQYVRLQALPLGFARRFNRDQRIVDGDRHEIQQHAKSKQVRDLLLVSARGFCKRRRRTQRDDPGAYQTEPERARNDRRESARRNHPKTAAGPERRRTADIPGGQADKGVHQEERDQQRQRLEPAQAETG